MRLSLENFSLTLKTAQSVRALNMKLTSQHSPCLTISSVELISVSSSGRIVTHGIPTKVIPRRF